MNKRETILGSIMTVIAVFIVGAMIYTQGAQPGLVVVGGITVGSSAATVVMGVVK